MRVADLADNGSRRFLQLSGELLLK